MSKNNYQKVQFISISLGGVPLALVCDKFPHFNSVTAVLGGDNLAINMWYGLRTRAYRTAFEKMHVGVRRLAEEWQDVAPEHHLRHFRGKPVKFVMSLNDEFVGTKFQRRLLEGLIENQAVVQVKKYRTGHLLSILRFCFFGLPL